MLFSKKAADTFEPGSKLGVVIMMSAIELFLLFIRDEECRLLEAVCDTLSSSSSVSAIASCQKFPFLRFLSLLVCNVQYSL